MIRKWTNRGRNLAERTVDLSEKKSFKERLVIFSLPLTILSILLVSFFLILFSLDMVQTRNVPEDITTPVVNVGPPAVEQLFNKKLSEFNIDIEQARTTLYWSPNDNYIIFVGLKNIEYADMRSTTVIADLEKDTITKIREGHITSSPTWSPNGESVVMSFEDGLFIYDVESQNIKKLEEKAYAPRFSPDGTRILYYNSGICIYDIAEAQSTRIADRRYYAAPGWFSDGKSIVAFREDEITQNKGVHREQVITRIEIDNFDKQTDIISMNKNRIIDAAWLKADETLYLTVSDDGTNSYYIANLDNRTNLSVGELKSGIVGYEIYVNKAASRIMKTNDGKVEIFDYGMNMVDSIDINLAAGYPSRKNMQDYRLLTNGRIVFNHINIFDTKTAVMIADPSNDLIYRVEGYDELSRTFVSNNGDKLALLIGGGKRLKIIDASKATGEVVPSVLVTIGNRQEKGLADIFPKDIATEWVYEGSAGHSHALTLDEIIKHEGEQKIEYWLSVWADDSSDNNSDRNPDTNIKYEVTANAIREYVELHPSLPHRIKELDIIRIPTEEGNSWIEEVIFDGEKSEVMAEIVNVEQDDVTRLQKITVNYSVPCDDMPDGFYRETRVIKSGVGIESFNNTYDASTIRDYKVMRLDVPDAETDITDVD